mgnify:CR=1 FL=1|jgi:hypothetical protein
MAEPPTLTIEQLAALRDKTDAASRLLDGQLRSFLDILRPILSPKRVLGRHVAPREDVTISDRMLDQLKAQYSQAVSRSPYAMSMEFPERTLTSLDHSPIVYPVEYGHTASSGGNQKLLTITSPVRWMLTYESTASPALVRQMLEGKAQRRAEMIEQFVVNALVMGQLIQAVPGIPKLLGALRYRVQSETLPVFGGLPLVTLHACLESFLPADDLLMTATAFSGVPSFVELVWADSLQISADPVMDQLRKIFA